MGKYVQDSITELKDKLNEVKDANATATVEYEKKQKAAKEDNTLPTPEFPKMQAVVIRVETSSGSPDPRLLMVKEVHDDYFVGRGRKEPKTEKFSFTGITNWRFAEYVEKEWINA